ncbi:MAG: hypothetical protein RL398_2026, partial [Planctomycetota bacterium]
MSVPGKWPRIRRFAARIDAIEATL